MYEQALIEDGYSVTTTIPRTPGVHPAVQLRYRPALFEQRAAWQMGAAKDLGGRDRAKRAAEILKSQLESWDIRTAAGVEAKISPDMLLRLQPVLFDKMLDLVLGYSPVAEEADAKNSSPASTS